jgi:H+-transporting ATPase
MTPGLSVIIDAIKESRRIVQRMNSYAIYRIAETLRVLGLVTLVILLYNFFPVTAIMIVLLAILNDGAILSIAYDNVRYSDRPEAWNMRLVLGMASVLGFIGPVAAFGLFYIADNAFGLGRPQLQTLMYLMLSVAGHLTIFLTRTRGPFWSIRPARILVIAVIGAQTIATIIAVGGILVTPLPWYWALAVWGYAILWFLLTDRVKLFAYRMLDPAKNPAAEKNSAKCDETAPAPVKSADPPAVSSNGATRAHAYHTTSHEYQPSHRNVYHTDDACPYGSEITASHRQDGTGGRNLCRHCAAAEAH